MKLFGFELPLISGPKMKTAQPCEPAPIPQGNTIYQKDTMFSAALPSEKVSKGFYAWVPSIISSIFQKISHFLSNLGLLNSKELKQCIKTGADILEQQYTTQSFSHFFQHTPKQSSKIAIATIIRYNETLDLFIENVQIEGKTLEQIQKDVKKCQKAALEKLRKTLSSSTNRLYNDKTLQIDTLYIKDIDRHEDPSLDYRVYSLIHHQSKFEFTAFTPTITELDFIHRLHDLINRSYSEAEQHLSRAISCHLHNLKNV